MKKVVSILASLLLIFAISACSAKPQPSLAFPTQSAPTLPHASSTPEIPPPMK